MAAYCSNGTGAATFSLAYTALSKLAITRPAGTPHASSFSLDSASRVRKALVRATVRAIRRRDDAADVGPIPWKTPITLGLAAATKRIFSAQYATPSRLV